MKYHIKTLTIMILCGVLLTIGCVTSNRNKTLKYDEELVSSGNLKTFRGSTLDTSGPVPFLTLKGNPYDQGLAYGVLLADKLAEMMVVHEQYQKTEMSKLPFYLRVFASPYINSRVKSFLKRTPLRYMDEMQGMADGSGGKLKWIATGAYSYYLNIACTSVLAVPGISEGIIHGHNLDFSHLTMHNYPVIVKYIPENGPIVWTINTLGNVPFFHGVNEYGISVSINTLDTNVTSRQGTPVFWKIREILDTAHNLEEADDIIRSTENDNMNFLLIVGSANEGTGVVYNLVDELQKAVHMTNTRPLAVFNRTCEDPDGPIDTGLRANSDFISVMHENNRNRQKQADSFMTQNKSETKEAVWELLRCHDYTDRNIWGNRGSIANSRNLFSVVFDHMNDSMSFSVADSWASLRQVWNFNLEDSHFTPLLPAAPYTETSRFRETEQAWKKIQMETLAGTLDFGDFDHRLGPYTVFRRSLHLFKTRKDNPEFLSLLEKMAEEFPDNEICFLGLGVYYRRLNPEKAQAYFKKTLGFTTLSPLDRLFTTQYLFDAYSFSGDKTKARETARSWLINFEEMNNGYQIPEYLEKTVRKMKKAAR